MKIEKAELAAKLNKVKAVVPAKTTIESLQGVLLKDNHLMAYNLEIGMKAKLDIETDESFIIPSKMIDLITKLPDGVIEITADEKHTLTLKGSGAKSKFSSLPPSQFPEMPSIANNEERMQIDGSVLVDAIKKVIYSVQDENIRPTFTGMLFECKDGTLNLVGTDGYRIAWGKIEYEGEFKLIIPKVALQKLTTLHIADEIEITHNSNLAIFKSEEYTLISRLITGDFIDYGKLFKGIDEYAVVDRKSFVSAAERLLISTAAEKLKVPMRLEFKDNQLRLSNKSSISEYDELIELDQEVSEEQLVNLNARYVIEAFKVLDADKITLNVTGDTDPVLFMNEDKSLVGLILPIRVV